MTSARSACCCVRRRWRFSGTRGTVSGCRYRQSGKRRNRTRRRPFSSPTTSGSLNPGGSWAVAVLVGDLVFPSLAEYADELESMLLENNLEILVKKHRADPAGAPGGRAGGVG